MTEEKGPFGVLPQGPIRKALMSDRKFKDRPFAGVFMKDTDEARTFRSNTASYIIAAVAGAGYLASIIQRMKFLGLAPV